jgi:hypothetical protein
MARQIRGGRRIFGHGGNRDARGQAGYQPGGTDWHQNQPGTRIQCDLLERSGEYHGSSDMEQAKPELTEATAVHVWLMETAGYFQAHLLELLA